MTWPVASQVPICLPSGEQIDLPAEHKGPAELLPLALLPVLLAPAATGATGAAGTGIDTEAGMDGAAGAEAGGDATGEATGAAPKLELLPALLGNAGEAAGAVAVGE